MSGNVPMSSGAELGNLLSMISSQNSINSLTLSCLSVSALGSDGPSIREDGREEEADELGRVLGGASVGRQVYINDSSGGLARGLDTDAGLGRVDMMSYLLEMVWTEKLVRGGGGVDTLLTVTFATRQGNMNDVY